MPRVLFLHGIGGPSHGSHSRAVMLPLLAADAEILIAPNLQTDGRLWSPFRKNAVLWHMVRQPLVIGAVAVGALLGALVSGYAGVAAALGILGLNRKRIVQDTLDRLLSSTVAIAERALAHARATLGGVDVIVGQSFGGAVACMLVANGSFDGPVLLTAPAIDRLIAQPTSRHMPHATLPQSYERSRMVVLSGTADTVVDSAWLGSWCARQGVRFVEMAGSEHNLGVGPHAESERSVLRTELRKLIKSAPPEASHMQDRIVRDTWRTGVDTWLTPDGQYIK